VIENTGFDFDRPAEVPTTPAPSAETLHLMRTVVAPMLAEVYPQFAEKVFGVTLVPSPQPMSSSDGKADIM
jgi:glutaconate CoA-transferase subunit B